jgi:large subunit ribosomal protein L15
MYLNTLSPAAGSKVSKKRCGRGIGSGLGKTCGRGHKGQKSRSGGKVSPGFEGGQMPLKKRLPKFGFKSRKSFSSTEVRLGEIEKLSGRQVDLECLRVANIVTKNIKKVKIILSGNISRAVIIKGLCVTEGAQAAIKAVGGRIE